MPGCVCEFTGFIKSLWLTEARGRNLLLSSKESKSHQNEWTSTLRQLQHQCTIILRINQALKDLCLSRKTDSALNKKPWPGIKMRLQWPLGSHFPDLYANNGLRDKERNNFMSNIKQITKNFTSFVMFLLTQQKKVILFKGSLATFPPATEKQPIGYWRVYHR